MESADFLTPEECADVDRALMTAREKFSARVALYALRSLKQIALENSMTVSQLAPQQIEDWVYQDDSLQTGTDRTFRQFFSQLVVAALKPLTQIAQSEETTIDALTVAQVIAWFEAQAALNLNQRSSD